MILLQIYEDAGEVKVEVRELTSGLGLAAY